MKSKKQILTKSFFWILIPTVLLMFFLCATNKSNFGKIKAPQSEYLNKSWVAKADSANPYLFIISQSGRKNTTFPSSMNSKQFAQYSVNKKIHPVINENENKAILRSALNIRIPYTTA